MADENVIPIAVKRKVKSRKPGYQPGEKSEYELDQIELETLSLLVLTFPKCFSWGADRRPLKIGIDVDIHRAGLGIERKALKLTLFRYASHPNYKANMIAGKYRIGLNGEQAQIISSSHQYNAQPETAPEVVIEALAPTDEAPAIAPSGRPVLRLRARA